MVNIHRIGIERVLRAIGANPAVRLALPDRRRNLLFPVGKLPSDLPARVDDKGGAVEDELILPANAIEIRKRQAGIGNAALGQREPHIVLVDLIGAAIGHDHELSAPPRQMLAYAIDPDIFADRHTDFHTAKIDRIGRRAGLEQAQLVERAVIGQPVFVPHRRDFAAVKQRHAVAQLPALVHRRADEHRRAARRRRRGHPIQLDRCALY